MLLIVVCNLMPVAGVLAFGWPAGNVFLLFILENVLLGLVTLALLLRTPSESTAGLLGGRFPALFFAMHYGIFASVHAVFTALVAYFLGVDFGIIAFAIPVVLLFVRYGNEFTEVVGGGRPTPPARSLMVRAYGRLFPLHIGVLVAFTLVLNSFSSSLSKGGAITHPTWNGISVAALAVALLMVLKTISDLVIMSMPASRPESNARPSMLSQAMQAANEAVANGDVTVEHRRGRFRQSWTYRAQSTSDPDTPRGAAGPSGA